MKGESVKTWRRPRATPWSVFLPSHLVEVVLATLGNVEASGEGRRSSAREQRTSLSGCRRRRLQLHWSAVDRGL